MTIDEKYEDLKRILKDMGGVLVAHSGGVDSTLLAKVAYDALGTRALAVTVRSQLHAEFEEKEARSLARDIGIPHEVVEVDALSVAGLVENPPERCYICKNGIFGKLLEIARARELPFVAEGSNASDTGDFRPGMKAVRELGVRSPLLEAGLTKEEIRELSRRLGLASWDKPSYACLASRIPYGERITREKLRAIEQAEDILRWAGYRVFRVRHHGKVARIEMAPEEMKAFLVNPKLDMLIRKIKALGFSYVALDLEGYRTGSLNEPLARK